MKKERKLEDCYREAGREVVAAGLNIHLPDRSQALAGSPPDYLEAALIAHLSGTIAVKFWHDHKWSLGRDALTHAQVLPLLVYLCPSGSEARKAKFRACFEQAAACVRHCETYIKAAALALQEAPEMGSSELRRLALAFFEPAGRGETCFGCGGGF